MYGVYFDLEQLCILAQEDPVAFERKAHELIEASISSAPAEMRPKLRALQNEINARLDAFFPRN